MKCKTFSSRQSCPLYHQNQFAKLAVFVIVCGGNSLVLCDALSSSPSWNDRNSSKPITKIISRKGDGGYKTFALDHFNPSDDDNDVGGGVRSFFQTHKMSLRINHAEYLHKLKSALRSTFLPTIPSIAGGDVQDGERRRQDVLAQSGYLKYMICDNLQDLSTSLRSVLATQRILEGVGVGRTGATALSATLNFLIRDGCGMIASLLFTSLAASSFRRNVKRWKYFADYMVDIGITLEIIAPSVLSSSELSGWFLPLLCLGNVCKALCGVAAGACGGAINLYWAMKLMGTEEGISEVSAKIGAQRTVVGGAGLVLAGFVAKWLGASNGATIASNSAGTKRLWIGLYCCLTFLHLVLNWISLKLVALDWMNRWRMQRIVDEFLSLVEKDEAYDQIETSKLSTPLDLSKVEPLFFHPDLRRRNNQSAYSIQMGVSFNDFARHSHQTLQTTQAEVIHNRRIGGDHYMLTVGALRNKNSILICFFGKNSCREKAKAFLHARLVEKGLAKRSQSEGSNSDTLIKESEENAARQLEVLWPIFEEKVIKAGWNLDKTECSSDGYEIHVE